MNFKHNFCFRSTETILSETLHNCDYCDYKATQLDSLEMHMKTEHGKMESYSCEEEYEANFFAPSSLNIHVDAKHQDFRYICDSCDFRATHSEHLFRHINAVHLRLKNYSCGECDAKFSTPFSLKRHADVKHKGVRHNCEQCDYKATRLSHLRKHFESVHLKIRKYACQECDAKFAQHSHLKRHENGHRLDYLKGHVRSVNLKKVKDNQCEECGAKFSRSYHLKRHVNSKHRGVR